MKSFLRFVLIVLCAMCSSLLVSLPSPAQTFSTTGVMHNTRVGHTETLLQSGLVLIVGGQGPGTLNTAELYNPATGIFTATGSLTHARYDHTATLLNDGTVLIAGGFSSGDVRDDNELYDPATGTFIAAGTLVTARVYHTATLLANGMVFLVGGQSGSGGTLSSAEFYNPATKTCVAAPVGLTHARFHHSATTLQDGRILFVGGFSSGDTRTIAEIYNPTTGAFTDTAATTLPTVYHTATLLNSGQVLIAGGNEGNGSNYLSEAELYNPTTGLFTATGSLHTARETAAAALLNDGTVLIAGGFGGTYLASAEIYNPVTGTFSVTGSMATARAFPYMPAFPVLGDPDTVLIAGGHNPTDLSSAELYHGPPTLRGMMNSKYIVLSVQYAPPGAKSFVDYGTSTNAGTSTSMSSLFSQSNMTSVSVGLGTGKSGDADIFGIPGANVPNVGITTTASATDTVEQDSSSSVAFTKMTSFDFTVLGPASNSVGLDHANDTVTIWLNPVLSFAQTSTNAIELTNVFWDTRDGCNPNSQTCNGTAGMDTVTLSIAELLNPSLITDQFELNQLARNWAPTLADGSSPGLTPADLQQIAAADPYSSTTFNPTFTDFADGTCSNASGTTPAGRYCLTTNSNIMYAGPQQGGQSGATTYKEAYTVTATEAQGGKDTHTTSFSVDVNSSGGFLAEFDVDIKNETTLTWTNMWSTQTSKTTSSSVSTTITPPVFSDGYTGPTQFAVYQDSVYGTLMFQPVIFPGYILAATPASQSILAGAGTSYAVSTTTQGGFTGTLNLSVTGYPSGVTPTFVSSSIAAGSGTTLNIATTTAVVAGTYTLTISAVHGTDLAHTTQVTLIIGADPNFSMAASPSSQTVTVGGSTTYTVSTSALNGFTGSVGLTMAGLPPGATALFSPTSITGSGSSTVTVTTATSTPAGGYTLTITGTSGSLVHSTTVTLVAAAATKDFTISITPGSIGVLAGGKATYTVSTTAINGFTGSVTLTLAGTPAGATAVFSPNPVVVPGSSTLTVTTSTSTPVGTSTLTVTGTSGALVHTTAPPATLTVDAP